MPKTSKRRQQSSKLGYQANWELIIICGLVIYEIYMFELWNKKDHLSQKHSLSSCGNA